jgi:hypothetical protein
MTPELTSMAATLASNLVTAAVVAVAALLYKRAPAAPVPVPAPVPAPVPPAPGPLPAPNGGVPDDHPLLANHPVLNAAWEELKKAMLEIILKQQAEQAQALVSKSLVGLNAQIRAPQAGAA